MDTRINLLSNNNHGASSTIQREADEGDMVVGAIPIRATGETEERDMGMVDEGKGRRVIISVLIRQQV